LTKRTYPEHIVSADWQGVKDMLIAGAAWLEKHVAVINALNVFPVPDGDTGTNMFLTMQATVHELESLPEHTVSAVMHAAAHGALMGARGNSGVILSQILRGMARVTAKKKTVAAADVAAAFTEGSATAYKGVIKPVEGTLLTVAREVAQAATAAAAESDDLRGLLRAAVEMAKDSVARTPSLLPVLREAGVVDAGVQGFCVILEGAWKFLNGEDLEVEAAPHTESVDLQTVAGEYGYDVQFILQGANLDVDAIRQKVSSLGDSALVVGDSHAVKVHVHVQDPGEVLGYGAGQGSMGKVIVENMQEQYQDYLVRQSQERKPPAPSEDGNGIAIAAVVSGQGLVRVFESLGATVIIPGGQTMNPSTAQILQAVEDAPAGKVIILPNNGNIVMAARAAQEIAQKQVAIIPSDNIPQGIAALLAFSQDADLQANCQAMERALCHVQTVEITRAVRSTHFEGIEVRDGAIIGLLNGKLTATGQDSDAVVRQMLDAMGAKDREIVTIYYGQDVGLDEAERVKLMVQVYCPQQEVELVDGGQLHYSYIISSE
jgi:uncharacterized protein